MPSSNAYLRLSTNAAAAEVESFLFANTGNLPYYIWVAKSGQSIRVLHPFYIHGRMLLAHHPSCSAVEGPLSKCAHMALLSSISLECNIALVSLLGLVRLPFDMDVARIASLLN